MSSAASHLHLYLHGQRLRHGMSRLWLHRGVHTHTCMQATSPHSHAHHNYSNSGCKVGLASYAVRPPVTTRAVLRRHLSATASSQSTKAVLRITHHPNGVTHVQLARPDKLNALSLAVFRALDTTAANLAADPSVRAVVLSGQGRAFCAGLDVKAVVSKGPAAVDEFLERDPGRPDNLAQAVGFAWRQLNVPVVAALHGVCLGGGLQIALGADVRVASPDCRLAILEAKWGIIPDMSGSITLRELIPLDVAKRLTWTGEMVQADEALRLGLVDHVDDDPIAWALSHASELAAAAPVSTEDNHQTTDDTQTNNTSLSSSPSVSHTKTKQYMLDSRRNRYHGGERVDAAVDTTVGTAVASLTNVVDDVGSEPVGIVDGKTPPPPSLDSPQTPTTTTSPSPLVPFDASLGVSGFLEISIPATGPLPPSIYDACRALAANKRVRGLVVCTDANTAPYHTDNNQTASAVPSRAIAPDVLADVFRCLPFSVLAVVTATCGVECTEALLGADVRFGTPTASLTWPAPTHPSSPVITARLHELCGVNDDCTNVNSVNATPLPAQGPTLSGVVHVSESPRDDAQRLAKAIVFRSPDSVAATKALFHRTWHASEQASLIEESLLQLELLGTYNQMTAAVKSLRVPVLASLMGYRGRQHKWITPRRMLP
eukprot:m.83214 g.83214  ORF g.83214 m.83214 type:complete len:658 (+) comp9523_c0_seq1:1280-3253(+)